ncbi:MAG: peptidylprolyl isomerase [Acidobacteriaceae bacterium]|nr:peptidylprolyl isomerase [Acidobacteriaceae bacterium]
MTLRAFRFIALTLTLAATAFAQSPQDQQNQQTPPAAAASSELPDAPSSSSQARPPAEPTGPAVVIDTSMGRLTCKLYEQQAPVTVANFIGLAEGTKDWTDPTTNKKVHGQRFYDGTTFHRVIPGFMIQGGDRVGDGTGDPGYYFKNEIDPALTFDRPGRLAMANAGPDTNGSQFFITEAPSPDLNGGYTIFGQCDDHSVVIAASIARVSRDAKDKPDTPVTIDHVTIVRDGQPMPPAPAATTPAPAAEPAPQAKPQS